MATQNPNAVLEAADSMFEALHTILKMHEAPCRLEIGDAKSWMPWLRCRVVGRGILSAPDLGYIRYVLEQARLAGIMRPTTPTASHG